MEAQELTRVRGEVIEKFINVEWITNAIISQRYFNKVFLPFVLEVLYDEYCSFGLKRRILEKTVPDLDKKQIESLNRLNTIRNYFSHAGPQVFKPVAGDAHEMRVPDPRELGKGIDFDELYEEFKKTEPIVAKYFFDLYQKLGGKASEDLPSSGTQQNGG